MVLPAHAHMRNWTTSVIRCFPPHNYYIYSISRRIDLITDASSATLTLFPALAVQSFDIVNDKMSLKAYDLRTLYHTTRVTRLDVLQPDCSHIVQCSTMYNVQCNLILFKVYAACQSLEICSLWHLVSFATLTLCKKCFRFQNEYTRVGIALRVVQFWSEIKRVITKIIYKLRWYLGYTISTLPHLGSWCLLSIWYNKLVF